MDNLRGALLMILAMAGFAVEDALIKLLSAHWPTGQIIASIGFFGAPVFALWCLMRGLPLVTPRFWHPAIVLRNGSEALGTLLFVTSLTLVPLSLASAILQAAPLLVTLGAALFLGEQVGWRRWVAIGIGFVGVLVILQPGYAVFAPAAVVPLASAFMFALYGLLTRYAARKDSTATSFFWTGVLGAVVMTVIGIWYWEPMTAGDWLWMGALCITGALGHWLLIKTYEVAEASAVQPFAYLQLVFAAAIGIFLMGETLRPNVALGAAIVVGAGLFTLWRARRAS